MFLFVSELSFCVVFRRAAYRRRTDGTVEYHSLVDSSVDTSEPGQPHSFGRRTLSALSNASI